MSIQKPMYKATPNGNVEFTEEEYAEFEANQAQNENTYQQHLENMGRADRNEKLRATDWRAGSDLTMSDEWKAYRQALRDVPAQAGFPNSITWPTEPS
tara:strand:- start:90 stop:383 length:294 start_codon:yes stop_codon:yes gene_type:complete